MNCSSKNYIITLLCILIVFLLAYCSYLIMELRNTSSFMSMKSMYTGDKKFNKYARAYVEKLTFYAQKNRFSNERIARNGILFYKPHAQATILICHGFMCDKTDIRFLRMLFEDYNVVIFDFRAHGESKENQCCTFGHDEALDIHAIGQLIKADMRLKKLPLIVYGFSMGAVSSIHAQSEDNTLFDCAIWDCPFDSSEGILTRSIQNLSVSLFGYTFALPGRGFLKKYAYNEYVQSFLKSMLKTVANMDSSPVITRMVPINTVDVAKKITIPALFITCHKDDKAPPAAVQKVYEGTNGYKRFWITGGRRHFDSFFHNPEKYTYKIRKFIEEFLDKTYEKKAKEKIYYDGEIV